MVAVDLDNIVQYQPPATMPLYKAPSRAYDLIPQCSAHSPSDVLQVHQAPPYVPWSVTPPLPTISSLQADANCPGSLLSPSLGTETSTNILNDAFEKSPPRGLDGIYRAWTEPDHKQGSAEIMLELRSTDVRKQDCVVGSSYEQGTKHQHDITPQDSHGQGERTCTSGSTPDRDDLDKEISDQPEPCILPGRAATANKEVREAAGAYKDAGVHTVTKRKSQDGVGVHTSTLINGPDLPITSVKGDPNTMVRKPSASAFPERPPVNKLHSQSTREDPDNIRYTMVHHSEDGDECEIQQHDADQRLASCQTPSSCGASTNPSTLAQKEGQSPHISVPTLEDLPLFTATTTDPPHFRSGRRRQPRATGHLAGVSDGEGQESDDPDDDDYLEEQPDDRSDNDHLPCPRKRQKRTPTPRNPPHRQHSTTPFYRPAVENKPNTVADVSLTSLHDVETIPVRGFLTRQVLLSKVVYSVTFEEQREHACDHGPNRTPANLENKPAHPHVGTKRKSAKRPREGGLNQRSFSKDDQLLIKLKEQRQLSWNKIAEHFPSRSKGSLQVRYSTRLKNRSFGNVVNDLGLKTNSDDAPRAPRQSLQRGIDTSALFQARYGPSRFRHTVNRFSPS